MKNYFTLLLRLAIHVNLEILYFDSLPNLKLNLNLNNIKLL
jgi:hypothetical protein